MRQAQVGYQVQSVLRTLVENPNYDDDMLRTFDSLAALQTEFVMKRHRMGAVRDAVTVYLLDMEGTTAPLPAVSRVLQWQREKLDCFVNWRFPEDEKLREIIRKAAENFLPLKDALDAPDVDTEQICSLFAEHISELRTAKGIYPDYYQELMMVMMEEGFTSGTLKSQIFDDAAMAIKEWGSRGQKSTHVAIWSACPKPTAEMLLRYSSHGDLTPYILEYFDPKTIGSQLEARTYVKIRNHLQKLLDKSFDRLFIVFVTDNSNGAVAANASDVVDTTFLSLRPLNNPFTLDTLSGVDIATLSSFHQLRGGGVSYPLLCAEARTCMHHSRALRSNGENV